MRFNTRFDLVPHPASPPPEGVRIAVDVAGEDDGSVRLAYRISAPAGTLMFPEPALPGAVDGLWQRTCCEAFVAAPSQATYTEFNFSPSGQWAIYAFDDYRQRSAGQGKPIWQPAIGFGQDGDAHVLRVRLDAAQLPARPCALSLACVLQDAAGGLSYWALRHPGATPDFHHRDGFALMLTKECAA